MKRLNYLWLIIFLSVLSLPPLYGIPPTGHCDGEEPSKAPIIPSPEITYSGNQGECDPGPPVLEWCTYMVGDGDDSRYKANVTKLTCPATINIKQWSAAQTPNPVMGGNVTSNNWQAIIQELQQYDTDIGGESGPNWHTTEATKAHEMYHFNQEWMEQCVKFYWSACEQAIESYEEKDSAVLEQKVSQRFYLFKNFCDNKYATEFDAIDGAGEGSGAWAAGKAVLLQVIADIQAFAEEQGWTE